MTTYQMYLMILGFLEGAKAPEEFKDILLELYKRAVKGKDISEEVQHENKEIDAETIRTTNDMIESTVAQLERVSKHLGSIGETENYTDYAINALEDFGKAYKCGLDDAWECAIHCMELGYGKDLLKLYSALEAIEKIKEYERQQLEVTELEQDEKDIDEALKSIKEKKKIPCTIKICESDIPEQFDPDDIRVGDEVIICGDIKGFVTEIIDLTDEVSVTTVYGWSDRFNKKEIIKTGNHYPQIEEVLKELRCEK